MTQSKGDHPTVLIVDDTPANLSLLFDLLGEAGYTVLVAEDGESAIKQTQHRCPDLILLDVLMPRLDGFSACRLLKEDAKTRDIPVIFMTAVTDTAEKVKGFKLGAVDYITKPFQNDEVIARVSTHIMLRQLTNRVEESEQRLSAIIESALDAIVILDDNARITLFNSAAERVFRCSRRDAGGQAFEKFLTEDFRKVLSDYMDPAGLKPAVWVPEGCCALRRDGAVFPVEASLSCTQAAGQTLYTIILRDIEERKKAEAEYKRLRGINTYLKEEICAIHGLEQFIGGKNGMGYVMKHVQQVAGTDASVLVTGETGTGKELIVHAVHRLSRRGEQTLVKLNCGAIPENLVESELFGHEKGAFTGASSLKIGRFELADGGTLFLDEIGEMHPDVQTRLLRVLQEGAFERVGGTSTLNVDVRIIAATNRDLAQCVRDGTFREDLFYRLNVFPIAVPPLRERRDDIEALVDHFVRTYAAKFGKKIETVPAKVRAAFYAYHWPGNVRELQHLIERAVILSHGPELAFGDWFQPSGAEPQPARVATLEEIERNHILTVLKSTGWRVSGRNAAAELLGLKPTTLQSRIKKLGLSRDS